jgi:hypothetical protein
LTSDTAATAVTHAAPSPAADVSPEPSTLEQQQQQQQQLTSEPSGPVISSSQLQLSAYELLAGQQLFATLDLSSLGGLAGGRAVKFTVVQSNTANSNNNNGGASTATYNNNSDASSVGACSPDATSTSSAGFAGSSCSFLQPGSYAVAVTVEGASPQPLLSGTVTVSADPAAAATMTSPSPSPGEQ